MSALPSPSKSPAPLTCQALPGFLPTTTALTALAPLINLIAASPLSFCHRMSALPSPLKSPSPLMCHAVPGLEPTLEPKTGGGKSYRGDEFLLGERNKGRVFHQPMGCSGMRDRTAAPSSESRRQNRLLLFGC